MAYPYQQQPQQYPPPGSQQQQQWYGPPQQGGGMPPQQPQGQQYYYQGQPQQGGMPQQPQQQQQPGHYAGGAPPPQQQQQQPPRPGAAQPQGWCGQYYSQIPQQELYELQRWFRSMDRDNSGSISANELANVAVGGSVLGIDNGMKLIRVFDVDGNGTIDFNEYASLHKFLLSMQQTFKMGDKDGNGRLDAREIHEAILKGGFTNVSFKAAQGLYNKYNRSGMGLNMAEFISIVAHIALARSVLERLDYDRDGRITVNIDQMYEISANF
jgi:Ca2+-binding EF-hand superfamily protein